jgi:hypothetical protein
MEDLVGGFGGGAAMRRDDHDPAIGRIVDPFANPA